MVHADAGFDRIPYALYHDRDLYAEELVRIFEGETWSYLGLEAEIPNPGDFRTTFIGETPVIYNRDQDGRVHAFVNRCSHRGALIARENFGNTPAHVCLYHSWAYDLTGALIGVPHRHGIGGSPGMPADFDMACHGLRRLRVDGVNGVLFASFSETVEPLRDYLGPSHLAHLDRLFHKPVRVLGYQRQYVRSNWKAYLENVRDHYHGALLHGFQNTFGINRASHDCGSRMDARHRHSILFVRQPRQEYEDDEPPRTDPAAPLLPLAEASAGARLALQDPALLRFVPEFDDDHSTTMCSVFPNSVFQQIRNALAARQVRPKGPGAFELVFTIFGYAEDGEDMTRHRLRQANFAGPAGFVSLEDAEALEACQNGHRSARADSAVVEMGGRGPIRDGDEKLDDVMIRGFWSYYYEIMNLKDPPAG